MRVERWTGVAVCAAWACCGCATLPSPAVADRIEVDGQVVAQSQSVIHSDPEASSLGAKTDELHNKESFGSDGLTREHLLAFLAWAAVLSFVIGIPGWMGVKVWWKGRHEHP